MKPVAVAGLVAGVFVVGIAVGISLKGTPEPAPQQAVAQVQGKTARKGRTESLSPTLEAPDAGPSSEGPASGAGGGEDEGARGTSSSPDEPYRGPNAPPPPPPPPISTKGLEEAEKIRREDARDGGRGGGRRRTLVYPKDPEVAEKMEQARNARWERRLKYANDIRIKQMRESIGLTAEQERAMRKILDAELAGRMELVDQHRKKQLSDTSFDEAVVKNRDAAIAELKALLSQQQYAKYVTLKPRDQVLRDDVK